MIHLTKATPRELENVYREFENTIAETIMVADTTMLYNQIEFVDGEPVPNTAKINELGEWIFTERKQPRYNLEMHIQELDEIFGKMINKIREHLINQFDGIEQSKIVSFFLKNKEYFKKYLPENRKQAIYKQFVVYCNEMEIPKDYKLNDNEKELAKRFYEMYSHYYNKLNEVIEELKQDYSTGEPKIKPEFSLKEIALRYVYEGNTITEGESDGIAKSFGHTSGHKLKQEFDFFNSPANRKAEPKEQTKKTFENKIKLFEKVIKVLPDKYKQKALEELEILKTTKMEKYY